MHLLRQGPRLIRAVAPMLDVHRQLRGHGEPLTQPSLRLRVRAPQTGASNTPARRASPPLSSLPKSC